MSTQPRLRRFLATAGESLRMRWIASSGTRLSRGGDVAFGIVRLVVPMIAEWRLIEESEAKRHSGQSIVQAPGAKSSTP